MLHAKFSPDVAVNSTKMFLDFEGGRVCIKKVYNYINTDISKMKSMDLLLKVRRKTKNDCVRKNKRILGEIIEERLDIVDSRTAFAHWEMDTIVGHQFVRDSTLLTLTERKTSMNLVFKIEGKRTGCVMGLSKNEKGIREFI